MFYLCGRTLVLRLIYSLMFHFETLILSGTIPRNVHRYSGLVQNSLVPSEGRPSDLSTISSSTFN